MAILTAFSLILAVAFGATRTALAAEWLTLQFHPLNPTTSRALAYDSSHSRIQIPRQRVKVFPSRRPGSVEVSVRGAKGAADEAVLCNSLDLCAGSRFLARSEDQNFRARLALTRGGPDVLNLARVLPRGDVVEEPYLVVVEEWGNPLTQPPPSRGVFRIGAGTTQIQYRETGYVEQAQTSLTTKLAYRLRLGSERSRWNLETANYFTALTFSTEQENAIRFLGLNLRMGYDWTDRRSRSRWSWGSSFGFFYETAFVANNAYGFSNLLCAQVYPTLAFRLSDRVSIASYVKFSPIVSGAQVMPLSNREWAAGLAYRWRTKRGHELSLGFDYSNLQFTLDLPTATAPVKTVLNTAGLSFSAPLDHLTSGFAKE